MLQAEQEKSSGVIWCRTSSMSSVVIQSITNHKYMWILTYPHSPNLLPLRIPGIQVCIYSSLVNLQENKETNKVVQCKLEVFIISTAQVIAILSNFKEKKQHQKTGLAVCLDRGLACLAHLLIWRQDRNNPLHLSFIPPSLTQGLPDAMGQLSQFVMNS